MSTPSTPIWPERIVIIGTSGSGKTTLAHEISEAIGLPHTQLDALHWGPSWTPNPDFIERVERAASAPRWVIDGNYSRAQPILWSRAQAIIWLNYPFLTTTQRIIRRSIKRIVTQEPLFGDNRESFKTTFLTRDSIIYWSVTTWAKHRQRTPGMFARYPHLKTLVLTHPAQAQGLLKAMRWTQAKPAPQAHTDGDL